MNDEYMSQIPESMQKGFEKSLKGKTSPRGAIKAFCQQCTGWNREEVRNCTAKRCPLYHYRPYK